MAAEINLARPALLHVQKQLDRHAIPMSKLLQWKQQAVFDIEHDRQLLTRKYNRGMAFLEYCTTETVNGQKYQVCWELEDDTPNNRYVALEVNILKLHPNVHA